MSEPKTIRHAIRPFLVINFVTGLGCYELKEKQRFKNWINIAYPTSFVITFNFLVYYTNSYFCNYLYDIFGLYKSIFWMIFYCHMILMTLLIITANMKIQIRMYGILVLILLGSLATTYWWQMGIIAPSMVKFLIAASLSIPVALIGVSNLSFIFWISYTRMKFHQLNNLLRAMLANTPNSPMHKRIVKMIHDYDGKTFKNESIRGVNRNANMMRAVKQIHLELIKISRIMNDFYGIQVLLTMFISLLLITCLLYVTYRIIWLTLPADQFLQHIGPLLFWLVLYMLKVFITNNECTKTSAEAADTGDLICELYEPSTTKGFRAEIRHFTLQMIQNPLVFTACGFFDMDHTFIQGVVGTITTYLVILIQVGDISPYGDGSSTANATSNATVLSIVY
ncbi:putative gustatory receptor 28a [Colletes gigas]|uniref:putative gustatory receptor 28a n=1 Tax=Colletes gigas TaxID=935657 RepID=UPI001C9B1629|nr:putative gustatory receptor 28a [Colletes gigas]